MIRLTYFSIGVLISVLAFTYINNTYKVVVEQPEAVLSSATTEQIKEVQMDVDEKFVFDKINTYRRINNLKVVRQSDYLCDYAKERLTEIQVDFNHDSFMKQPSKYATRYENLGKTANVTNIVEAWVSSKTHNDILLSKMDVMCIQSENGYWTLEGLKYAN